MAAYSGGADSSALLYGLHALRQTEGFELSCVHVNHGLRPQSLEEEAHAIRTAEQLGVPIFVKRVLVTPGQNLEASARTARHMAFREAMKDANAQALALGHHADDQAETLLMRLMYGTGPEGLGGMSEYCRGLWRPLLPMRRDDLRAFLLELGVNWVEDSSNLDEHHLRNYLRHQVMPLLERRSPGFQLRVARTAALQRDEQRAWRLEEDAWLIKHASMRPPFVFLMKDALLAAGIPLQRRLLRRLCAVYHLDLEYGQLELLRAFVSSHSGGAMNLPLQAKAFLSQKRLHIIPDDVESMQVAWQEPERLPTGGDLGDGRREQVMNLDALQGAAMRCAKPGDHIKPLGMTGSQPLKKYLSAKGVDRPFRAFWPVYAIGQRVLWVPGMGIAQEAAVLGPTTARVRLRFLDALPDEINELGGSNHGKPFHCQ